MKGTFKSLLQDLQIDSQSMEYDIPIDISDKNVKIKSVGGKFELVSKIVKKKNTGAYIVLYKYGNSYRSLICSKNHCIAVYLDNNDKYIWLEVGELAKLIKVNKNLKISLVSDINNDTPTNLLDLVESSIKEDLFDIEVPSERSYFSNGILNHNSMYGPKETTSGGNALAYYAHVRVRWKATPSKKITGSYTVEPQIKKNKLAPIVLAESKFEVMSGVGVMKFEDYLSASKQIGVIEVHGPSTTLLDGDKEVLKVKSAEELKEFMKNKDNEVMWSKLIHKKWDEVKGNFQVELSDAEQMDSTIEAD